MLCLTSNYYANISKYDAEIDNLMQIQVIMMTRQVIMMTRQVSVIPR